MADDTNELLKQYARSTKDVTEATERYNAVQAAQAAGDKVLAASLKQTASQTEKLALQMVTLTRNTSAAGQESEAFKKTLKELGDRQQAAAEKAAHADSAITKMRSSIKGAAESGEALAKGIGLGIVAVGALTAAIYASVTAADDWNEELKKVGLNVQNSGIDRAAASFDTIGTSLKALGVEMIGTFSPQLEAAGTRMTAFGLASIDAWNNFASGGLVMERIASFASTVLVEALFAPLTALQKLSGVAGPLLAPLAEGIEGLKADQADAVTAALKMMVNDGLEPLIAITDDYMVRAGELVTRQTAINVSARQTTEALTEQADVLARQTPSILQVGNAFLEVSATFRDPSLLQGPVADQVDASIADFKRLAAEADATAARGKASWTSSFASIGSSAGQLSELLIKQSKKQGDAAEKAAIIAFRVQQASGIVGVAISTAQAIMQALGTLPPPASYVAAGAAALAGVAQAAVILAQPPPTSAGASGTTMPSAPSAPSMQQTRTASGGGSSGQSAAATGGTTGVPANINVARAQDAQTMVVTDAYIPPTSSSRLVRIAAGDEGTINRAGALGRSARDNPEALLIAREQLAATREQNGLLLALQTQLLYRQHVAAVPGPSGSM